MYAWKCWRESRKRFCLLLILSFLLAFVSVIPAAVRRWDSEWRLERGGSEQRIAQVWRLATSVSLVGWGTVFAVLAALGLGTFCVGEEYKQGTLTYLLTKPRPRSYFLWVGWLVGALELMAILLAVVLGAFLSLLYLTGVVFSWRFFAMVFVLLAGALVLFGQTYFFTVLRRSARDGLTYSLGTFFILLAAPRASKELLDISLPSLLDFMRDASWVIATWHNFPVRSFIGWMALALAFPYAADRIFRRMEL